MFKGSERAYQLATQQLESLHSTVLSQDVAGLYTEAAGPLSIVLSTDTIQSLGLNQAGLSEQRSFVISTFDFVIKLKALYDTGTPDPILKQWLEGTPSEVESKISAEYDNLLKEQGVAVSTGNSDRFKRTAGSGYEGFKHYCQLLFGDQYQEESVKILINKLNFTSAWQVTWRCLTEKNVGKDKVAVKEEPSEKDIAAALKIVVEALEKAEIDPPPLRQFTREQLIYQEGSGLTSLQLHFAEISARLTHVAFNVGRLSRAVVSKNADLVDPGISANFGSFDKMIQAEMKVWDDHYSGKVDDKIPEHIRVLLGPIFVALQVLKEFVQLQKMIA